MLTEGDNRSKGVWQVSSSPSHPLLNRVLIVYGESVVTGLVMGNYDKGALV